MRSRFLAALPLLIAAVVAGCGQQQAPGGGNAGEAGADIGCPVPAGPIGVATSGRANSPVPVLPPSAEQILRDSIYDVPIGDTGPTISLVEIDGRPSLVAGAAFSSDAEFPQAVDRDRETFLADFRSAASGVRATEPEADVLGALGIAARAARDGGSAGTVVLVDSGLQTVTPLDFSQPGLLDAAPAEVVEFLDRTSAIPDLSGLTVLLAGIGDTAPPQQALDIARQTALVELWSRIARSGGAACVHAVSAPRGSDAVTGVPPVSTVEVPPPPSFDPSSRIVLPDNPTVGFVPGEAVLRDAEAAAGVLRPVADWLAADSQRQARITGTTARHGSLESQIALAFERAETIKRRLVDLGADPTQITTEGVGSEFPGYVPDQGPDGGLLPGPASRNRSVIIEPIAD
ncbi:MAG: OmpA family protein [Pseudonocardiaceae bacterium]|nr:OmpA family protein [Pseudonocardiaceae bacterium]